jgi:hypothetical protein
MGSIRSEKEPPMKPVRFMFFVAAILGFLLGVALLIFVAVQ